MTLAHWFSAGLGLGVLAASIERAVDLASMGHRNSAITRMIFGIIVSWFLLFPAQAAEELPPPRERTEIECKQAAKLMYDTAVYRDKGGYPATVFERFMHDLELAKQYPPKARWFVEETQDAMLLYTWLQRIFAEGETPDTVRFKFMIDCMGGRLVES